MNVVSNASVLLLSSVLATGCAPKISLRVLEPAAVAVPPHIDKVAVVSRTRPGSTGQKVLNVLEGALTGEAIGADRAGAASAKRGVVNALAESPRYDVVTPALELEGWGGGGTAAPLAWPRVEDICRDVGAQGLVVLESFDTDSYVEEHVEKRTRTNDAGREVNYKVFHAQRRTSMSSTWRFYDASNRLLIDELWDHENTRTWDETGDTPSQARSQLPAQIHTIEDVASRAGHDYGRRIAPSWLMVRRSYYGKGDPDLVQAKKHVKAGQWAQAEAIWTRLSASSEPDVKGKALYNLALARERDGALDAAADLARQADALLGKRRSSAYVSTLEIRRGKQARLERQMAPVAPPLAPKEPSHAPAPMPVGDSGDSGD